MKIHKSRRKKPEQHTQSDDYPLCFGAECGPGVDIMKEFQEEGETVDELLADILPPHYKPLSASKANPHAFWSAVNR